MLHRDRRTCHTKCLCLIGSPGITCTGSHFLGAWTFILHHDFLICFGSIFHVFLRLENMPPNLRKSCRLCGSDKHTLATCGLRGAKEFRSLLKQSRGQSKSVGSRVCRGNGEAARRKFIRKPAKKVQTQSRKKHKAAARKLYSGDSKSHDDRVQRKYVTDASWKCHEEALTVLQSLGFLYAPHTCPTCSVGQMLGPIKRHDVQTEGSLHYRCSNYECKRYVNALACQSWLQNMKRFSLLTPSPLLGIIHAYLANTAPRPGHAFPLVPWSALYLSAEWMNGIGFYQ